MKIVPIYKNKILSLPAEIIGDKLSTVSDGDLKVLFSVYLNPEFDLAEMSSELDMTEKAFMRSLDMWQDSGALVYDREKNSSKKQKSAKKTDENTENKTEQSKKRTVEMRTSLPSYASDELAAVMERVKGSSELIDSCQQTLGKIFNTAESSKIIALSDQLSLSNEYILLLCSYAVSVDKKSVRYIERLAIEFYDKDIVTYASLEEELNEMKAKASDEAFVRSLFGIGKRALIKKEKEAVADWTLKYGFSHEMIEKAYEITVSKTNEAKITYANAILERWYAAGLKTPEDVDSAESERSKKNSGSTSSFSTNDFYEAALHRSYDNKNESAGGKK